MLQTSNNTLLPPEDFAAILFDELMPATLCSLRAKNKYKQYRGDPCGFCREILNMTITDDIQAMMCSVCNNQITVAISANATGKSHGAARVAIWFYLTHSNCKVFTAAAPPYENLKNILWGEIGGVVTKYPELFVDHVATALDIRRGPEDFLTGVTIPSAGTDQEREAKFSGKHSEHMLFVLDEGDAIPDDVYKGIESCMSGGIKVRLLIMLNPRQASGAVFRMQRDRTANIVHLSAFSHPNVISGNNIIPGAVDRETTVRRINEWTRPAHDDEKVSKETTFMLPDFLEGATAKRQDGSAYQPLRPGKYKIINSAFAYMVLGQYPAAGSNQLISQEWISNARARYDIYMIEHGDVPPLGTSGIMGLDVAEFGDDPNVAVGRYGGYLTKFDEWNGVDPIVTGSKAVDWYSSRSDIIQANVDGTGVGAGVAYHMQRLGCVATSIKVAATSTLTTEMGDFRILRDELWWRTREWLRTDAGAMLPPDTELVEELLCPTYSLDFGKIEVMKKKEMKKVLKRSSNKADALNLTFVEEGFLSDCIYLDYPD